MNSVEHSTIITAIVSISLFVIGGAMKWLNGRLNSIEGTLYGDHHGDGHDTKIAVIKSCQENTVKGLDEIKESMRDNNIKLDKLLLALQK